MDSEHRLAAVISPLRRSLLAATRADQSLPELPDSQIEVLRALPRGVISTPSDLAALLGLSRSTTSNLVTAMVSAGLLVRRSSPDDRRRVEVLASPRALRLFEQYDNASARLVAVAVAGLDPKDQAALEAAVPALERLQAALADARMGSQAGAR
ncbi:MarR family winged helix-turn-helix transcriptional regulator [Leifsonia sp. 2MCAF36]|uniref:MarR family winged helix-turn-helix transcriptional regulator n=1 Tax=Leifsonia sp. 2MCAF36 TaxID=3232988 RepID=UPI003F986431